MTPRRAARLISDVPEFTLQDTRAIPQTVNACKDCRWAQAAPRPNSFKCRRNPPVVHQARPGEALFPIVEHDDWCGEFSQ